jgi:IS605 OrfB family transposase
MHRTISIKLCATEEQNKALLELREIFNRVCNSVVSIAMENRCWNRVKLHHLSYYQIRFGQENGVPILGSQMVCNAIKAVCDAYKVLKIRKDEEVPKITFRQSSSIHFDKRTYSIQGDSISLYTIFGRVLVPMKLGEFQSNHLQSGRPKEAELILRNGQWFFNLVLDMQDIRPVPYVQKVLGVDLGENNLAATSTGKLFGGCELRHERDCALALRGRLQSNGSESSRQLLKKISGKEARHVKHVNHVVSKKIVEEAQKSGCDTIAMESLTNIRKGIRAGKRVRSRLHRWPWAQLQDFISYKAQDVGIKIIFVNPAYTSQTCSDCERIGIRHKHKFECKFCGIQRHSDLNASRNIRRIAVSAGNATGTVNYPHVAVAIN